MRMALSYVAGCLLAGCAGQTLGTKALGAPTPKPLEVKSEMVQTNFGSLRLITGDELKALIVGSTIIWSRETGERQLTTYKQDGFADYRSGTVYVRMKYTIVGSDLCWPVDPPEPLYCFRTYADLKGLLYQGRQKDFTYVEPIEVRRKL